MRLLLCLLALTIPLLKSCAPTTTNRPTLSCEQKYTRDLERVNNGTMSQAEAIGNYTQCLIDRGDTVNSGRALIIETLSH